VILANLSRSRVEQIIDRRGLPQVTENTVTSREKLYEELEEIRDREFAFNKEESVSGLRAVGVPVMTPQGDVLGTLSVSGPSNRLQDDWFHQELLKLLLGTVNEIEFKISYS
jgi:DNA-binding IclR family transcriptional regulator